MPSPVRKIEGIGGHAGLEPVTEIAADPPQVDVWIWAERLSIVGLFVLALGVAAYATQAVLVPILLAWTVATIFYPIVARLTRMGLSRVLASLLVALAFLIVVLCLIGLFSLPLTYWIGRTAELGALIRGKLELVSEPFAFFGELSNALGEIVGSGHAAAGIDISSSGIFRGILSALTPVITEFLLFFGAMIFYLIFERQIREGVAHLFNEEGLRRLVTTIFTDIDRNMSRYFGACAVVNICLGVVTATLAYAVGLPQPLLWGVFAAVMNFVPYIGPAVVVTTLFAIGVLSFQSLGHALIAPAAYVAIAFLEGQFITPSIVGRRLTLNPFLIFVAIAFWSWMWGPIGAFLAVPLVMSGVVAARHLIGHPSQPPPSA